MVKMVMVMKRRLVVCVVLLMALAWLVSACGLLGGNGDQSGPGPTTQNGGESESPPDLGVPDGVAEAYLNSWANQNYEAMYSFLSPNSQAEYTLEDFVNIHTSTADTMQMTGVETTLISVLTAQSGTTAQAAYRVTYDSTILGSIERDLTMQLVYSEDTARWGIVWTPGLIFPELAGGNTLAMEIENPSRANIYDRSGLWMVSANAAAVKISIVPGEVGEGFEDDMLTLLSQILRMPADEIKQQYASAPPDWTVALGVADAEIVQANWNALNSYSPPLTFEDQTSRRYYNVLAPHVLGYTGYIQTEQLDAYRALGYQGDEIVGQMGLEQWGEQYLAGRRGGTLSAYTPDGQFFSTVAERAPEPAQSIYTTLDRNLQAIVQDAIEEAYRASEKTWAPTAGGAAVVVVDVNTGAILAMDSYPRFDPNIFNPLNYHPLATESFREELLNDPLRPLLNRATQGQYAPGSIFKMVTATAALDSGLFSPNSTYTCTGQWNELGTITRYDWLESGHGTLTLSQGLTASCNPWFYHIGLTLGRQDYNLLPDYARQYGFGSELGIEIPENSGLVPDPKWMLETRGEDWTLENSVNMAIGQGDLLVSPLQIAMTTATIANGGTLYQPHLVDRIGLIGEDPSVVVAPTVMRQVNVAPAVLATIREAMHAVASDRVIGTAEYRLGSMEIQVAGKTGTAQVSGEGYPLAWFAGFAPYDDPEIAVAVLVENGGQGSSVAAPIFRRIVEKYYDLRVLPYPADWSNPDTFDFVDPETGLGE